MTTEDLLRISLARRAGVTGEGKRLRHAAHLSLRNVSDLLDCDPASVARYENGSARPGAARARLYGELLVQWLAIEAAEVAVAEESVTTAVDTGEESEVLALV